MIWTGDTSKGYGVLFVVWVVLFTLYFFAESFLHYNTFVAYALVASWFITAGLGYSAKSAGYEGKLYFGTYTLIFYIVTGLWRTGIALYEESVGFGFLTYILFNIVMYIPFVFIGYAFINNIKAIKETPQYEGRINNLLTNIGLNDPSHCPDQDYENGEK